MSQSGANSGLHQVPVGIGYLLGVIGLIEVWNRRLGGKSEIKDAQETSCKLRNKAARKGIVGFRKTNR